MKKLLLLAFFASMIGTAHATRSRMNSLGQNENQGSFYLMDNRNFFRNPANASKMRNFMVAELAQQVEDETGNTATTNVEGGFFGEFNSDLAYGVYLGKEAVVMDTFLDVAGLAATDTLGFPRSNSANPLNIFLGGGADMKWGLDINYANTEAKANSGTAEFQSLGVAAGIETNGGLQVYAAYIGDESKNGTNVTPAYNKLKTTGYSFGVIYSLNADTTVFGQYDGNTTKATGSGSTTEIKYEGSQFILGLGRIYELSPTARFNFDLSWNMAQTENKNVPSSTTTANFVTKATKNTLPLVIGLEADATEWLILRASVRQNFILGNYKVYTKTGTTTTDSTDSTAGAVGGTKVAFGGTFHFGKLKIDGNLGGFGGDSSSNLFDTSNFFVNAAATYMF